VDENSTPIYGLFISLLKEAWNYNIFTAEHKDSFNEWRARLSDNMKKLEFSLLLKNEPIDTISMSFFHYFSSNNGLVRGNGTKNDVSVPYNCHVLSSVEETTSHNSIPLGSMFVFCFYYYY